MRVLILSTYIHRFGEIDALRKEVIVLYNSLKNMEQEFQIYLVSVEDEMDKGIIRISDSDILITSFEGINKFIYELKPDIIHILDSTPYYLQKVVFSENRMSAPCKIVITCIDNDPLEGVDDNFIEEIVHLSEFDECIFYCYSTNARQVLLDKGIMNVKLTLPLVNKQFFNNKSSIEKIESKNLRDCIKVGFASTPFSQDSYATRGLHLISNLTKKTDYNLQFYIPWREKAINPPEELVSCEKVKITYGFVDMMKFYQEIDIYILPFQEFNKNHASPHSFWEAVYYGKPVIVTNKVGVAPIVDKYGVGLVVRPESDEILNAIVKIINSYDDYIATIETVKVKMFLNLLDQSSIISEYVNSYKRLLSDSSKMITLEAWKKVLSDHNKELVKGVSSLKLYYTKASEAATYRDKRFTSFPMDIYNLMEIEALKLIISKYSPSDDLKLMDIAAGEGRITEVLINYGEVIIIENSLNMLKILMDNCKQSLDNRTTFIKGDFHELDLSNYNNYFDIITTFRFVRHFEYIYRRGIYEKIFKLLKPEGLFIIDVPNKVTEIMLRDKLGWENFNIYDMFWTAEGIRDELSLSGFEIVNLIDIGKYLFKDIFEFNFGLPISRIVVAKKPNSNRGEMF